MAQPPPLPLQLPGHGTPSPAAHLTFAAYYGDPELDPCKGDYRRLMERFDPDVNNVVTPLLLQEQAVASGIVPQAYLCCAQRQDQVRIYCVHLPSKFPSALDGTTSPWDGSIFAFLGDLVQGVITTIQLPALMFRFVPNTRTHAAEHIATHLDDLGPQGLPEIEPDAGGEFEVVNTRTLVYLPARYVPLFLDPSGYTLRQVWESLYPAMLDANDLQACSTLLKWLRVASMSRIQADGTVGPPVVNITLTVPMADATLIAHRKAILNQALPSLNKPPQTLELAISQMAAAVTQNTNDNRLARDEKELKEQEPRLPSFKFKNTIGILLNYLVIADETNLPELWHQWANCTKRQELQILNELLYTYSRGANKFSTDTPVITPKLVQDLLSFTFMSESTDDIKTGIQPFAVADGNAEYRRANLELSQMYSFLASGETALMYSDLELLKSKETLSIPLNYFELDRNLGMFGNLLGVVLGDAHPLTTAYQAFWILLNQTFRTDVQQIVDVKNNGIRPAHILRSIHLLCHNWFRQRRQTLTPLNPNFEGIIHNLCNDTNIVPYLPPSIHRLAFPRLTPPALIETPSLTGTSTSSNSSGTMSSSNSSVSSTISGLTRNSGTVVTTGSGRATRAFQVNLAPDITLHQLLPTGVKLRDLIGSDPPPNMDSGIPICLSYHCTAGCWSNCGRAASHGKTLSAQEKTRLVSYLQAQTRKIQARPTGTATVPSATVPSAGG
jgi:hypothetical protein